MSISIKVHSTDTENKTCIATIKDGDTTLVDMKNIGLTLNDDGTANTDYIKETAKELVRQHRISQGQLLIDTGE